MVQAVGLLEGGATKRTAAGSGSTEPNRSGSAASWWVLPTTAAANTSEPATAVSTSG